MSAKSCSPRISLIFTDLKKQFRENSCHSWLKGLLFPLEQRMTLRKATFMNLNLFQRSAS